MVAQRDKKRPFKANDVMTLRATASQLAGTLLAPFREIPVDGALAERAGRIRRERAASGSQTPSSRPPRSNAGSVSPLGIDPTSSGYGACALEICKPLSYCLWAWVASGAGRDSRSLRSLECSAPSAGFEPATHGLGNRRSIP